ncbi:MAG: motility associated factor glycosyltransferase family protein [Planctomycetota bacterium]|jgi:hypothetical protein
MSLLLSLDHLDRSLEALGPRHASLAAAIRAAGPHPGLDLIAAPDGTVTGSLDGVSLASRHDPSAEARRIADRVDVTEHAVVVVHGFGLGHHVMELCRRVGRTGVVIVLETDLQLLHSALGAIDHAPTVAQSNLVIITDGADRSALARRLQHAEWLLGQGVAFVDHAPSMARLGEHVRSFSATLAALATHVRLTLSTTLLRSVETVRNLTGNLHRYATGPGITDLAGAQAGRPAVLVAAGPSLGPALQRLADPRVRERAVIIAAQTTLRPLLDRGIRPHFVTALDYHRISARFYEGLTAADVAGVELVVDPKAHPSILESFPGVVRCIGSPLLDAILGGEARPMGSLTPGATVAHLSAYLARHLGCDPIITVGQDLGFTDCLYYGPDAVIHETWGPELGPFNPITSMEWQRIARHRRHLQRLPAWNGGTVLSDAQMVTYLQQFERDFAHDLEQGLRVIDATGPGGTRKTGADPMRFDEALDRFATTPLAPMPPASRLVPDADDRRLATRRRVEEVRRDVLAIRDAARASQPLLREMLEAQDDPDRLRALFEALQVHREGVGRRMHAFGLVEHLNQLGAFKRIRADRRMNLASNLDPRARQRAELERDLVNVEWTAEAAEELDRQLQDAARRIDGGAAGTAATAPPPVRAGAIPNITAIAPADGAGTDADVDAAGVNPRVGAVIAIDLADAERLSAPFGSTSLLGATLERLARSRRLDEVLGERGRAVRIARAGGSGAWRGGIAGFGGLDDAVSPRAMRIAAEALDLGAVLPCGPDRPLLDPQLGVDALIDRWREHPDLHRLVFTPLPPGLGAVLLRRDLATDFEAGGRLGGAGPMLIHQPHVPRGDPLTGVACVPVEPALRRHADLIAADEPRRRRLAAAATRIGPSSTAAAVLAAVDRHQAECPPDRPSHLLIELSTGGPTPRWRRVPGTEPGPRRTADADRLAGWLETAGDLTGTLLTLTGDADPLSHPGWPTVAGAARAAGAIVHVRTPLDVDPAVAADLTAAPVDIVSVELHANSPRTWARMHGRDGMDRVLAALDALLAARRPLDAAGGLAALAVPWVVPRMQRRPETIDELEGWAPRCSNRPGRTTRRSAAARSTNRPRATGRSCRSTRPEAFSNASVTDACGSSPTVPSPGTTATGSGRPRWPTSPVPPCAMRGRGCSDPAVKPPARTTDCSNREW